MPSDFCYGFLCFVPLEGDVPQIFGFSEFIAGLALMVLAWTIAGIAYRFRVRTAPIPLVNVTFGAISEFPKWSKYLILLSFQDNSSARSVQIGGWM